MFFTGLSELMQEGQIVNLNLMKKGDKLFISLMPKVQDMPEAAMKKLIPLNLNGTAHELDQGFLDAVSQPVQERFGLLSNAEAFRENTKSAATKKTQVTTSNTSKETKLTKNERMLADAEAHEKAGRFPEAYQIYKKASAADPGNIKLKEKVMEVWSKMAQRPLFKPEEDQVQVDAEETLQDPSIEDEDEDEVGESEVEDEDETEETDETVTIQAPTTSPVNVASQTAEEASVDMFAQIMGIAQKIG